MNTKRKWLSLGRLMESLGLSGRNKIFLNSGKQTTIETEFEKEDELVAELQKKKILKKIADSKTTQIKAQIMAQRKTNNELDREIEEMRETIKSKLDQNEKMSIRAKELKGMIAERKTNGNLSGSSFIL